MFSSHEYEKDRTSQHKKRKGTLLKTVSLAKMNTSEAKFSDDNYPIDKEEGVNDRKYDKNKEYDEGKEPEFPDDTSIVDMEEDVIDRKYLSKTNMMREKRLNALMTPLLLKLRKV